jgi:murein L,D-transpeptidase YcbB/YkuD
MLPAVKRDPDYFKKRNINVIDRDGNVIDQSSIDWSQYPGRPFPYMLRQEPGPDNALGQVKFIFPNKHFVYLHDTPSKSLFDRSERTFSSGCIRVEKPFELAELLLNNPKDWSAARIREVIDSKETLRVFLPEPMPVLLLYWTVAVDEDGTVHFKQDPYGRDKAIIEGLTGGFRIRSSHGQ